MKKLVVFASGSGTNAENLVQYFAEHQDTSRGSRLYLLICVLIVQQTRSNYKNFLVILLSNFRKMKSFEKTVDISEEF